MDKNSYSSSNRAMFIFVLLVTVYLLYLLKSILMPFLAGALIAYLSDPAVIFLMRFRLSRLSAAIIVFTLLLLCIVLLFVLLFPLIQHQIIALILVINKTLSSFQENVMPWLLEHIGSQPYNKAEAVKNVVTENLAKTGSILTSVIKTLFHSGKAFFESVLNIILIPVVTFYLLRDWDVIIENIRLIIPKNIRPTVVKLTKECDAVLSAFFRGQLLVMLFLGIFYAIGLSLIGLQIGMIIGLIVGLVSIVPYLGLIIGLSLAVIASLIQHGTWASLTLVLIVFALGQLIESTILTPKLIGDRIGLHPVAVIFAILAGGVLFGFFGILLALPVAAVIMVLLRSLYHHHENIFYSAKS